MALTTEEGEWIAEGDGSPMILEMQDEVSEEYIKYKEKRDAAYKRMLEVCSQELKDREKQKMYPIVDYFETHDEINRATVQTLCKVSLATSLNYLNRLIELNVIEKTNNSVATVYKIVI